MIYNPHFLFDPYLSSCPQTHNGQLFKEVISQLGSGPLPCIKENYRRCVCVRQIPLHLFMCDLKHKPKECVLSAALLLWRPLCLLPFDLLECPKQTFVHFGVIFSSLTRTCIRRRLRSTEFGCVCFRLLKLLVWPLHCAGLNLGILDGTTDCLVADKDEAAVSFSPLHPAER